MITRRARAAALVRAAAALALAVALTMWPAAQSGAAYAFTPSAPVYDTRAAATTAESGPAPSPVYDTGTGRLRIAGLVDALVVEMVAPDPGGVIRPVTRTGVARVEIPGARAGVFAMHAGPAGAPGTPLTGADGQPTVGLGTTVELPDGGAAVVSAAWVSDKEQTGERLSGVLADPAAIVTVTCRVQDGATVSTANVVVIARRT